MGETPTPTTDVGNGLNNYVQNHPNPKIEKLLIQPLAEELYARTTASNFAVELYSLGVINDGQQQQCDQVADNKKNELLYRICNRKKSVSKLIVALEQSNNIHILEIMCEHLGIQIASPVPHSAARTEDKRTNETVHIPLVSNRDSFRIPQNGKNGNENSSQSERRESRVVQCSLLLRCPNKCFICVAIICALLLFIIFTTKFAYEQKSSILPTLDKPLNTTPFNFTPKMPETPRATTLSPDRNDNNRDFHSTLKAKAVILSHQEITVPAVFELHPDKNPPRKTSHGNTRSTENATPSWNNSDTSPSELPGIFNSETSTNRPTLLSVLTQSTISTTDQLNSSTRIQPSYNYVGKHQVSPFVNTNNTETSPENMKWLLGLENSSTDQTVTIETFNTLTINAEMSTPNEIKSTTVKPIAATAVQERIDLQVELDLINSTEKPVTMVITVRHKNTSLDYNRIGIVSITITSPNGLLTRELASPVVNLTIHCEKKYDWRSRPWIAHNGSNVLILTLVGCFNRSDVQYFLSSMKNIHTFRMLNDLCMCDEFEAELAQVPSKPPLIHENVQEIYISTVGNECDFLLKALSRFHFPNLKTMTFDHPYIVAANKEYFEGFVLRNQYNLKSIQFIQAVLCTNCDLFYNVKKCFFHKLETAHMSFNGLASSLISSFKTVVSLSFASPNLNVIVTNLVCEGVDIRLLLENWKHLDKGKSQLCARDGDVTSLR